MFHFRGKLRSVRWLFAEVLVVVLGILIAFQIDEWKTQREERRQEIVSLEAISSDLEIGIGEFRLYEEMADSVYAQLARIALEVPDGIAQRDKFSGADPEASLIQLTTPPNDRLWRPTATAFDSLRDTGNLNLISDHELRTALVTYFDTTEPYFLDIRMLASDARSRYLEALGKDFELVPGPDFENAPVMRRRLRVSLEDWPTDPEFRNSLLYYAERVYRAGSLANDYQDVAEELRSEISNHIEVIR